MLRPRIIPCLLVRNGGLVKTVKFDTAKYVGDPINAVRIFNEKEVDELILLDIDATVAKREPDYTLIRKVAAECRMPLCYGGGVNRVAQVEKIVSLGVEKVALSSAAVATPDLVSRAAEVVGRQSVVVVIDVKKSGRNGAYEIWTEHGSQRCSLSPQDWAQKAEELGAGEIVLNSMDNDGMMQGYDLELARSVREVVKVPMTVLGGAGSLNDIGVLLHSLGVVGAAAGSVFVFKGIYRAVLINYPRRAEKEAIIGRTGRPAGRNV
jgi:imidazole glycerol-phosphate synthase subunit HisF